MIRRRAVLAGLALSPSHALAAPRAEPWPIWDAHDPASRLMVDHTAWGRFLTRFLREGADGIARLDYRAAQAERAALEADIARLAALPIRRFNRAEQFAIWANLYNLSLIHI